MYIYITVLLLVSRYLRFKNGCEKDSSLCLTWSDSIKDCENILKKKSDSVVVQ